MDDIAAKMWKIDLSPERSIVIREQINRILKMVKKYSGVAAMAASFDPAHAGVAWAGVSAILPVGLISTTIYLYALFANTCSSCLTYQSRKVTCVKAWRLLQI
jgi:hypothetical protein